MILPYCTRHEFDKLTSTTVLRPSMREALHMVLVKRSTWSAAAKRHKVTQSGMLKAMRRVSLAGTRPVWGSLDRMASTGDTAVSVAVDSGDGRTI